MDLFEKLRTSGILLIDDDKWIRDSLAMYFEGEGCTISVCETAEEGLKAFEDMRYGTIIADYLLPGMDGMEFFRRISTSRRRVAKVLITAYGNDTILSEAKRIGIDAVIEKPFTVEILKLTLSRLIRVGPQCQG